MDGVWLSQADAEMFTMVFALVGLKRVKGKGLFGHVSERV